jgi:hypothetical protein
VRGKGDVVAGAEGALGFVGGATHETRSNATNTALTEPLKPDLRFTIICRKENTPMIAQLFDEYPMLLFVLEGLIALGILLAIVFWTGKGRKD